MRVQRQNTKAQRITERLRADICAGAFGAARLLPTEALLCERYDASRETIRKALRLLIAEGLLTRIPNRGVSLNGAQGARPDTDRRQIIVLTPYPFKSLNYYYHGILAGLVAGSHESGVALTFVTRRPETDLLAVTAEHPALLWPAWQSDLPVLRRLTKAERQFVVMSASFEDATVPCVDCDNALGARQAIDHLVNQGHRRIGVVARSRSVSMDHAQRIAAANKRLRHHRLPADGGSVFWPDPDQPAAAYDRAFRRWLEARRITAVFTLDLEIAGRVYTFGETQQVAIPKQLSVISFDDSELAEVYAPRITAIAQPLTEIGRRAVERLVTAVNQRQFCRGTERLPTKLIERESVAPWGCDERPRKPDARCRR
jgi:DNA-binding LacI/PurR family transcriptional regulator